MSYQQINQDNQNLDESDSKKIVIKGPVIEFPNQMKNWPSTIDESVIYLDKEK